MIVHHIIIHPDV